MNWKNYPSLLRQLMYNRGITDYGAARAYVGLRSRRGDKSFLIKDMDAGGGNSARARFRKKTRLPFTATMNVDGVTSSARCSMNF